MVKRGVPNLPASRLYKRRCHPDLLNAIPAGTEPTAQSLLVATWYTHACPCGSLARESLECFSAARTNMVHAEKALGSGQPNAFPNAFFLLSALPSAA